MRRRTASQARLLALVAALGMALGSCAPPAPGPSPFPQGTPRLILFLVVDQLSQEYLVRMRPVLSGGLAYLLDNGAVFADAHHNHADTVTGAGHATLATGCYPRRSGIISNQWNDRATGRSIYCVESRQYGRSPENLLVDTLADWLDEVDPAAKVFAAGGKDRSAVLTGGHGADAALWLSGADWITSGYYGEPEWLEAFNDRNWLDRFFATTWEPLPLPDDMLEALEIVALDEGVYGRSFPYAFGSKSLVPDSGFYGALLSSPFTDAYLTELAKAILVEEDLGTDDHPDFLGLAYHALDYVGHAYGPHSREAIDTILRLDQTLADLLGAVDERVGLDHVVISLSSDHGVMPVPEYRELIGQRGERIDADDVTCFQSVGRTLTERYGGRDWLQVGLYLDDEAIEAAGIDRQELERQVAALLGTCDSVTRVWTRSEMLDTGPQPGPEGEAYFRQLFYNSFHPERSADFAVQYAPYYLNRASAGTSHGTPYDYDTWVPMIIIAPGVPARHVETRVHTADLAPTIAGLMGIEPPATLDGVDRRDMLRGQ